MNPHQVTFSLCKSAGLITLLLLVPVLPGSGQDLMEHKLLASDAAQEQFFGRAVSLSGDRLLIGADGQDVQRLRTPGIAYIFERQANGSWTEVAMFRHDGPTNGDQFGRSVSLDNDRAIIAAPQRFEDGVNAGAVFVFERQSDGSWLETATLLASDGASGDALGANSISLSDDRALLGANSHAGVGTASGAAYLFERQSDGTWLETAKLLPADIAPFSNVGRSVALQRDRAIVGASSAVYVFEFQDNNWIEVDKITPQNPHDSFGNSVAVMDDRILVGANTTTEDGILSGAAYIFDRQTDGTWAETSTLTPDDATQGQHFGWRVSLTDQRALVSSWRDNLMGTAIGSAYVFLRSENGTWEQEVKLTASDGGSNDLFGISAFLSGNRAVLGASQANDFGSQSGAAYLYDLAPVTVSNEEELPSLASGYTVTQPFPNPLRTSTQFSVAIDYPQHLEIVVYNILGEKVQGLHNGLLSAMVQHDVRFNRESLPAGIYFIKITGEHFTTTRSIVLR